MLLKYFYDDKLAHASYMVGCQATGDAIIIDPDRNIDHYLEFAAHEEMRIIAATETHIHADFVSGSRELAARIGAKLYLSDEGDANWKYQFADQYDAVLLKNGDTWKIGNIVFEAWHTPGHTPEHMSFIVTDSAGASRPMGVFTGDFIFVGDVGRPDLLETAAGVAGTKEKGGRQLFHALQKARETPDYLQIWPGHGAGSACGKALGAIPTSTFGYEKMFNWAFSIDDEDKFVTAVLDGQKDPPPYFAMMKKLNKQGPPLLSELSEVPELDATVALDIIRPGAWVVDVRPNSAFAQGHIPGTISVMLDNSFSTYAGWVLPYDQPIYLIVDQAHLKQALRGLSEVGYDNIKGYFTPDIVENWESKTGQALNTISMVQASEIADAVVSGEIPAIDVRTSQEYGDGHPKNAKNIVLGNVKRQLDEIPNTGRIAVSCLGGGRSFVASSILSAHGFKGVTNIEGGWRAWAAAKLPVEK